MMSILSVVACSKEKKGGSSTPAPAAAAPTTTPTPPVVATPAICADPAGVYIGEDQLVPIGNVKPGATTANLFKDPNGYALRQVVFTQKVRDTAGNTQGSYRYSAKINTSTGTALWGAFQYMVDRSSAHFECNDTVGRDAYKAGFTRNLRFATGFKHFQEIPYVAAFQSLDLFSDKLTETPQNVYQTTNFNNFISFLPGGVELNSVLVDGLEDEVIVVKVSSLNEARTSGSTQMWVDTVGYLVYRAKTLSGY